MPKFVAKWYILIKATLIALISTVIKTAILIAINELYKNLNFYLAESVLTRISIYKQRPNFKNY
jgi:hypothetical protein